VQQALLGNAHETEQAMQQIEQLTEIGQTERKRVEAVMETLATLRGGCENLAAVAHDARNMVTALGLYCDLLEEPGVLAVPFGHYGSELRLVAAASRRLVEKLVALDSNEIPTTDALIAPPQTTRFDRSRSWDLMPAMPIEDLALELKANRNLLAALVGPSIALTLDMEGCAFPVKMTGEDLTRILVNLVKNSAEAMVGGGRISLGLHEFHAGTEAATWLVLTVEDTGEGIPHESLDKIFGTGYTTHATGSRLNGGWAGAHRGLGLSMTRSITEAAGGRIHAAGRQEGGARLEIDLPVRER
jgi:signal transduction histidine kinase